jgi:hypothetical protein
LTTSSLGLDPPEAYNVQTASVALRPLPRDYSYDLALSFAGEDREVARRIADSARANGLRVYFDEYHVWETWGKDLSEYLGSIYGGGARYCVILISEDYCRKPYTIFERRIALAHALEAKEEYVLPVVLDDSWPPGLPRTTAYLDLRIMEPDEIAEAVVRKIQGPNWEIRPDDGHSRPRLQALGKATPKLPGTGLNRTVQIIDFADIAIADECPTWAGGRSPDPDSPSSEPARWSFRENTGGYEDPIFDISIINRSAASRLITRIGIDVLRASFQAHEGLGGAGLATPIPLHRTYQFPMPDVWRSFAEAQRAAGKTSYQRTGDLWTPVWTEVTERSSCRLPDPIFLDPDSAYRFGLHLFDYVNLCPTEVELLFWIQTDQGEAQSSRVMLRYFMGKTLPCVNRYFRMLEGPSEVRQQEELAFKYRYPAASPWLFDEVDSERLHEDIARIAYALWESAGRPDGQDQEFWRAAKRKLGGDLVTKDDLDAAHKRPM